MKHPNIQDCQVIGINDEVMGEEVCAWIKLRNTAQPLQVEDIRKYCKGNIAHYKVPRYVRLVKEYPLTVTGKVKKNDMRHITNELLKQVKNDLLDVRPPKKANL